MQILRAVADMQLWADAERRTGRRIAVVPTMGALHRGHTSLIELARRSADSVVTTIFVNPTQFGPHEDLSRYPRPIDRDVALAEQAGSSVVFAPPVDEVYPQGFQTFADNVIAALPFEGAIRPGHFRGVTTIVAKLILATKPHAAVFGQKDAQQVAVVRALLRDLNFGVELIVGPIVREPDGLALSSRNIYLSADERSRAVVISQALRLVAEKVRGGERLAERIILEMHRAIDAGKPTAIDYIAVVDPDTFAEHSAIVPGRSLAIVAARFGTTRLLDNAFL
jgi:pantoate--beta-alanine ligase